MSSWQRIYAAAWLLFLAVFAAVLVVAGAPPAMAARGAVCAILPNALLGLLTIRLARRWPWPESGRAGFVARHAAVLLAVVVAATASWAALIALDTWIVLGAPRRPDGRVVAFQGLINGLLHLVVVGAGYAWHGLERAREAADREARAEALRSRAELALLRSQLNPHFVLNTLHALLGLVRRDPALAEAALERLGELLGYGLRLHQTQVERVAFREEWEFVCGYLELERLRLGDRLRLELSADPGAMDCPVPPFSLQPLVENAVIHGISPRGVGGKLTVDVRRSAGCVLAEVRDDGPGSAEAKLFDSPRLGLRLLRERLANLYAGRARLVFESPAGGGLLARLELPEDGWAEAA